MSVQIAGGPSPVPKLQSSTGELARAIRAWINDRSNTRPEKLMVRLDTQPWIHNNPIISFAGLKVCSFLVGTLVYATKFAGLSVFSGSDPDCVRRRAACLNE